MKKTFREKVMQKCMAVAKKHKWLKYPSMMVMVLILSLYYMYCHFAANGKRYAGIVFSLIFFVSSCSFSYAVFTGQSGFINAQAAYNEVVEYSDIGFAVEKEVETEENMLLENEAGLKEYESSENDEDTASYTLDDILGNAESYPAATNNIGSNSDEYLEGSYTETGIGEETPAFDNSDWRLVLVNKQHPIPEDYSFKLGAIKGYMKCDERIIVDLLSMLQAAKDDGINLMIRSPYRTDDRQETNFNRRIKLYMEQGYSYMEAYKKASRVITIPGASEHQIGLALDITSDTYSSLDEAFSDTNAGKWLAQHSCEYGFTLRYPEGKEYITGIDFEPWHFRYVGKDAATIMMQDNICLEEFWDKYL